MSNFNFDEFNASQQGPIPSYDPSERTPGQIVIPVQVGADPLQDATPIPPALDSFNVAQDGDPINMTSASNALPDGDYAGPGAAAYSSGDHLGQDHPAVTGGLPRHPQSGQFIPRRNS